MIGTLKTNAPILRADWKQEISQMIRVKPLPEDMLKDDIACLREEREGLLTSEQFEKAREVEIEIYLRLAQAKARGFNVEGW